MTYLSSPVARDIYDAGNAMPTLYNGIEYRSTLEARWAVFFDELNIEAKYEPQHYEIGRGEYRRIYLPDFYLPQSDVWVEVKGDVHALNPKLLVAAMDRQCGLPSTRTDGSGPDLLLLGDIPAPLSVTGQQPFHPFLCWFTDEDGGNLGRVAISRLAYGRGMSGVIWPLAAFHKDGQDRPAGEWMSDVKDYHHGGQYEYEWTELETAYDQARTHQFWKPPSRKPKGPLPVPVPPANLGAR